MARPGRLELPTLCLEGRRSIQLSYGRTVLPDSKPFIVARDLNPILKIQLAHCLLTQNPPKTLTVLPQLEIEEAFMR